MAELSTLSPSPPALSDPHAAPSITLSSSPLPAANTSVLESTREIPSPKSSLYNDKALTGNTPTLPSEGSHMNPHSPSSPQKLFAVTHDSSLVQDAAPQREDSAGKNAKTEAHVKKWETMTSYPTAEDFLNTEAEIPTLLSGPLPLSEVQQAPPCLDLNSGPNLYPSVHVTHNPNPVMNDGPFTAGQPQNTAGSNPTPAPPASTDIAATEEKKPQPLPQAQNPESHSSPVSPKMDPVTEAAKEELPSTPTRAEHPSPTVPLIHEPAFPVPSPNVGPALDTLSYLESASMMSGTLESLSGLGEDGSSVGSDSEINGLTVRRTDKYGFLGGSQYSESG